MKNYGPIRFKINLKKIYVDQDKKYNNENLRNNYFCLNIILSYL